MRDINYMLVVLRRLKWHQLSLQLLHSVHGHSLMQFSVAKGAPWLEDFLIGRHPWYTFRVEGGGATAEVPSMEMGDNPSTARLLEGSLLRNI